MAFNVSHSPAPPPFCASIDQTPFILHLAHAHHADLCTTLARLLTPYLTVALPYCSAALGRTPISWAVFITNIIVTGNNLFIDRHSFFSTTVHQTMHGGPSSCLNQYTYTSSLSPLARKTLLGRLLGILLLHLCNIESILRPLLL